MNIVLGAIGMLGQEVVSCLKARGMDVVGPGPDECDLTLPECVDYPPLNEATCIYNCAAYTDVPKAEVESEAAYRINRDAVTHLVRVSEKTGAKLVHVSTDFVFDGCASTPYDVNASPNPVQTYGASKRAGEEVLEASSIPWVCIRTAWLFGHGKRNFVSAICEAARKNGSVSVVTDEIGTPTYARDLAEAMVDLAQTDATGMFHGCNAGVVSRYDFACEILRQAGIDVPVHPVLSAVQTTGVRRPAYSALDISRLEAALGRSMRAWQDTLKDYFFREA